MKTQYTLQIEVEESHIDEEKMRMIAKSFAEGAEANADADTLQNMKITSVTASYQKTIEVQPTDTLL